MVTRRFIEKIRYYFNELKIEAKYGISFEEFQLNAIKTLNRSKDLGDAKLSIFFTKYCISHWNKIDQIFTEHLDRWQEYEFDAPVNIDLITDEDALGIYYITNGLTSNSQIFYLTGLGYDDELIQFCSDKGFYSLDDDYRIKITQKNSVKARLSKKTNSTTICDITFDDHNNPVIDYNASKYELVPCKEDDGNYFVGVFKKSYISSLKDSDYIEFKNMIASIEWDVFKAKSDKGVAKIVFYEESDDEDQIYYFALSTLLLYRSLLSFNNSERMKTFMSILFWNNIARRRIGSF